MNSYLMEDVIIGFKSLGQYKIYFLHPGIMTHTKKPRIPKIEAGALWAQDENRISNKTLSQDNKEIFDIVD